jgi:hypothetical protein
MQTPRAQAQTETATSECGNLGSYVVTSEQDTGVQTLTFENDVPPRASSSRQVRVRFIIRTTYCDHGTAGTIRLWLQNDTTEQTTYVQGIIYNQNRDATTAMGQFGWAATVANVGAWQQTLAWKQSYTWGYPIAFRAYLKSFWDHNHLTGIPSTAGGEKYWPGASSYFDIGIGCAYGPNAHPGCDWNFYHVGRHKTGGIWHGFHRTTWTGTADRLHSWTDHSHGPGWKYAAVWTCAGNPGCPPTDSGRSPECQVTGPGVHIDCTAYSDDYAYGYNATSAYSDPGTDCPSGLQYTETPWGEYSDGHGMCPHRTVDAAGQGGE